MNPTPASSADQQSHPPLGLAIASLVLGVLAVFLSFLLLGGLLGLAGLVLGFVHLQRRRGPTGMAWCGAGLSLLGILASVGFGALYYEGYKQFKTLMGSEGGGVALEEWRGVLAPDFTVSTLDGKTITLRELQGKRVVLDFWATWCPPCRKEIPHFNRLFVETSRDDLIIVGISSETETTLKEFVQKQGVNYPIASANQLPAPYANVRSIPTTFFIDRRGIIQDVVVGYRDLDDLRSRAVSKDSEGDPKPPPPPKDAGSSKHDQT